MPVVTYINNELVPNNSGLLSNTDYIGIAISDGDPSDTSVIGIWGDRTWSTFGAHDGDISEIIVYNIALSDENRDAIYDYLKTKWSF